MDTLHGLSKDIADSFTDEYLRTIETLERDILTLKDKERLDLLFRRIHSLKANASYFGAEEVRKVFSVMEDVLEIIRNKSAAPKKEITDWLLLLADHILSWREDIENHNFDVEPIDSYTLNMIKISTVSMVDTTKITKSLNLLIIDDTQKYGKKVKKSLEPYFNEFLLLDYEEGAQKEIRSESDIIIIIAPLDSSKILEVITTLKKDLKKKPYIILATKKPDKKMCGALLDFNIDSVANIQITKKALITRLKGIADACYGTPWISIDDDIIKRQISNLAPLPQTMIKLQEIVTKKETISKNISDLIVQDPILLSRILKTVNSPVFSLKTEITNIQNAVSLLGKERVAAIALQESIAKDFKVPSLEPYGISEEEYFTISRKRMELMNAWYAKVSFNMLTILSTTSLLGNLGQLLLADKIKRESLEDKFASLVRTTNSKVAEGEFLNITTEETTAKVLSHWGLSSDIIDSIKYSYNLSNAPRDIKQLAIANYVVFTTVDCIATDKKIQLETIENMCEFLEEMNLEPKNYRKACEKVLSL